MRKGTVYVDDLPTVHGYLSAHRQIQRSSRPHEQQSSGSQQATRGRARLMNINHIT